MEGNPESSSIGTSSMGKSSESRTDGLSAGAEPFGLDTGAAFLTGAFSSISILGIPDMSSIGISSDGRSADSRPSPGLTDFSTGFFWSISTDGSPFSSTGTSSPSRVRPGAASWAGFLTSSPTEGISPDSSSMGTSSPLRSVDFGFWTPFSTGFFLSSSTEKSPKSSSGRSSPSIVIGSDRSPEGADRGADPDFCGAESPVVGLSPAGVSSPGALLRSVLLGVYSLGL